MQQARKIPKEPKEKDINRGFKVASDGRLIIGNSKTDDSDSDDDSSDEEDSPDKKTAMITSDLSEDEDMEKKKNGLRKSDSMKSSLSFKSLKSKGIHRTLSKATVNESTTANTRKTGGKLSAKVFNKKQAKMIGLQYKAKKASGDLRKAHHTLDPYAYVPFNRRVLKNKSKAEKLAFKSLLKGVKTKINKSRKK